MGSRFKGLLWISWLTVLVFVFTTIVGGDASPAKSYGTISDLAVSTSDSTKSAAATYTISFTVETEIPRYGGRINVQMLDPYGYSSSNGTWVNNAHNFNSANVATGTSPSSIYWGYSNYNGAVFYTNAAIAAGTTITLKIGNVINPAMGGYYYAHVWTSYYGTDLDGTSNWGGDYNSSYVEIGSNTNFTGRITDSDGTTGVANANVYINRSSGSSYAYYSARTDKDGYYGIGDVEAGTYYFNMSGPYTYGTGSSKIYFPPDNTNITVEASGTTTKNASFVATPKTLSGKITKTSESGTAVTNATVYIYKMGGSGWANTTVDSSGNYSFQLPAGTWSIGIYATNWPADWIYTTYNETVSFASDTSAESKTKNFVVDDVNSTVTGTVIKSDGTSPGYYSVGINFSGEKNRYFYAYTDASGNFTAKVTAGTYTVTGWTSDSSFSFPKVSKFTVGENETTSIGTITLTEKTDSISGIVKDDSGSGVSGASINAWKSDGTYDYGYATTASDGTYSIKVTPGTWQVSAWPQWNSGYYYSGKPTSVAVTSGVAATQNFTFLRCTATINGKITDASGNAINAIYSWVNASDGSQEWGNIGTSIDQGTFTLKVPAGTWTLGVYLYGSDYGSPDPLQVTVAENEVKEVSLQALVNDATITGTIYDNDGNAVTGKWINVWATKGKNSSWQNATVDQSTGVYSIKLSAGTWRLGWWVDQSLGYNSGNGQDVEVTIASGETKTNDINLKKNDSTISGTATKTDGTSMQWAWITADTRDPNEKKSADRYYWSNGASCDSSGNYTINVPAGTYWVGGSMWTGSGYINPKRQKVVVDATTPATVNLVFRTADATISGTVANGSATSSFVTSWSEDGGYAETNSNNDGAYTLQVSSGTKWHVKAVKKDGQDVYKSSEYIVDLTETTAATQDIHVVKQDFTLPEAQSITFDPTKQQTLTVGDDLTVTVPANSMATSGSVTITIEPTIELPEESDAKAADYGYDMQATNQDGEQISTFSSNVTVEDHFTTSSVEDNNLLSAEDYTAAYYNESNGTWEELNYTVNEDEQTVTYQTNHFTKFALVAASDTTPPAAPSSISATAGDTRATLSWTNPTDADLTGIKVYRSTTSGTLGDWITTITGTTTTTYADTNLTNETTYYYTIKAYDTSGNLSSNTDQVSTKPSVATPVSTAVAATLPKTGMDSNRTYDFSAIIAVLSFVLAPRLILRTRPAGK
ncbi:MAG: carboxypeptidase regulatory-like domain-containing protein [Patescibacteria group bacterium]|jgi:protocatechuate 3,4-dioxygenase beta subunit